MEKQIELRQLSNEELNVIRKSKQNMYGEIQDAVKRFYDGGYCGCEIKPSREYKRKYAFITSLNTAIKRLGLSGEVKACAANGHAYLLKIKQKEEECEKETT